MLKDQTITLTDHEFTKLQGIVTMGTIKEMQSVYLTDDHSCIQTITLSGTVHTINDKPVTLLQFNETVNAIDCESIITYTDGTLYYSFNGTLTAIALNNILFTKEVE